MFPLAAAATAGAAAVAPPAELAVRPSSGFADEEFLGLADGAVRVETERWQTVASLLATQRLRVLGMIWSLFSGGTVVRVEAERTAAAGVRKVLVAAARAQTRRKPLLDEERYMAVVGCFTVRVETTAQTDRRGLAAGQRGPANINLV